MTAAAGPGPDPFATGPAGAGAGAASLDDVLDQLTVEAEGDPKYRGKLFEPVVIKWLKRVDPATPLGTFTDPTRTDLDHTDPDRSGPPPTIGDIAVVYSWPEFAAKFPHLAPRGAKDIGIDAVAEMNDGSLAAIQVKAGGSTLSKSSIDSFLNTAAATPGGVPRYAYQVLIYTNPHVDVLAVDALQGHYGGLVVDRPSFAAAEPAGGWQALLDNTAAQRNNVTRPTRTKGADGTPTPPEEIDGGTPPEPLTWAQTLARPPDRSRLPELADGGWLKAEYETAGRSTVGIAAELGCHPSTVAKALARHGIPARPNGQRRPDKLADGGWLKAEYETGGRSTVGIAAELGCHPSTVSDALREHGIPARYGIPTWSGGQPRSPELADGGWLKAEYETGGRTTTAIAAELGCSPSTVARALARHGIPPRPASPPLLPKLTDGGWLKAEYETGGRTTAAIAAELGCSPTTVAEALREHGIPVRSSGRRPASGG